MVACEKRSRDVVNGKYTRDIYHVSVCIPGSRAHRLHDVTSQQARDMTHAMMSSHTHVIKPAHAHLIKPAHAHVKPVTTTELILYYCETR